MSQRNQTSRKPRESSKPQNQNRDVSNEAVTAGVSSGVDGSAYRTTGNVVSVERVVNLNGVGGK